MKGTEPQRKQWKKYKKATPDTNLISESTSLLRNLGLVYSDE